MEITKYPVKYEEIKKNSSLNSFIKKDSKNKEKENK